MFKLITGIILDAQFFVIAILSLSGIHITNEVIAFSMLVSTVGVWMTYSELTDRRNDRLRESQYTNEDEDNDEDGVEDNEE